MRELLGGSIRRALAVSTGRLCGRALVHSVTLPQAGDVVWTPTKAKHGLPGRAPYEPASQDLWQLLAVLGSLGLLADWILCGRKQSGAAAATHTIGRTPRRKAS